jgi:type VI protein secretion system component Hcp
MLREWTTRRGRLALAIAAPVAAAIVLGVGQAAPAAPQPGIIPGSAMLILTPASGGAPVNVPITQYSFDVGQSLSLGSQSSGAGAGKVDFSPLQVTTQPDANTPELFQYTTAGMHFNSASLEVPTAGGGAETFTFGLVALEQISWSGGPTGGQAGAWAGGPGASGAGSETLTFAYGALTAAYGAQAGTTPTASYSYCQIDATGGWNRICNLSTAPAGQ